MLIRFKVSNFRSFNQEVIFSMLPGAAQKHQGHITTNHESQIDVLRFAMLYGANASGKSNLIRAISFARNFIIDGVRPKQSIPLETFRLDSSNIDKPSSFEFEFIVGKKAFAYGFLADRRRVHEEWLYSVNTNNEKPLFERRTVADEQLETTYEKMLDTDQQFLQFISRGTRPNELLLTKLAENNVEEFASVYEWFHSKLTIVYPHTRHQNVELSIYKDQQFSKALANFLRAMNTGVDEVCAEKIDTKLVRESIKELWNGNDHRTKKGSSKTEKIMVINSPRGRYLIHQNEQDDIDAYVLRTRRNVDGKSIDFEMSDESDGTQRLLELFPILYDVEERVFLIDELERSLHPNLVQNFIKQFLAQATQNQLIVTTHEATLLDLNIFRRDEIWFVEKSPTGASTLYSLEEFKPRHDLDIRKGYLQGRFGAVPVFGSTLQASPLEV